MDGRVRLGEHQELDVHTARLLRIANPGVKVETDGVLHAIRSGSVWFVLHDSPIGTYLHHLRTASSIDDARAFERAFAVVFSVIHRVLSGQLNSRQEDLRRLFEDLPPDYLPPKLDIGELGVALRGSRSVFDPSVWLRDRNVKVEEEW